MKRQEAHQKTDCVFVWCGSKIGFVGRRNKRDMMRIMSPKLIVQTRKKFQTGHSPDVMVSITCNYFQFLYLNEADEDSIVSGLGLRLGLGFRVRVQTHLFTEYPSLNPHAPDSNPNRVRVSHVYSSNLALAWLNGS